MEITFVAEHLKKEIGLYKEFTEVLQKETENLVGRDYKGLYETACLKEGLIIRIKRASRSRGVLMHEAAATLGIQGDAKLSSIIEKLSGDFKEELLESRATILSLFERIKEINSLNSVVVKEFLSEAVSAVGGRITGLNAVQNDKTFSKPELQVTLSSLEDADITKVISDFQLGQTALQASIASASKVFGINSFDYL